jgi:hypothetical protein
MKNASSVRKELLTTFSGIPTSIGGLFLTADATLASPEPSESSPGRQLHVLPTTNDGSIRVLPWVACCRSKPHHTNVRIGSEAAITTLTRRGSAIGRKADYPYSSIGVCGVYPEVLCATPVILFSDHSA